MGLKLRSPGWASSWAEEGREVGLLGPVTLDLRTRTLTVTPSSQHDKALLVASDRNHLKST